MTIKELKIWVQEQIEIAYGYQSRAFGTESEIYWNLEAKTYEQVLNKIKEKSVISVKNKPNTKLLNLRKQLDTALNKLANPKLRTNVNIIKTNVTKIERLIKQINEEKTKSPV